MNMQGKLCLVTGACSGIGRHTAIGLARLGAQVILLCRDPIRAQDALEEVRIEGENPDAELALVDLASQRSIRRYAEQFASRHGRLDLLVNNAGVYHARRKVTEDGIEATFAVNHLAPFLLTRLLLPHLHASGSARIVNLASRAARYLRKGVDFKDIQGERRYCSVKAYAQSKLANMLFTYALAQRLPASRITANCLHPGVFATGIFRELPQPFRFIADYFLPGPEQGARTSIHVAAAPELAKVSGRYFENQREATSPPASYDQGAGERLWTLSEELTGLSPWRGI